MLGALRKPLSLFWCGLCFAARWWPVWLVALVLFLANVPGEKYAPNTFAAHTTPLPNQLMNNPG
ncbi:MAG: hypothetical protein K2Y37_00540 [Pirellulales bacterium]|nr:hypothetical protein [Pirellulales bacterium]